MTQNTVSFDHWPYPRWIAHRGAGKLAPENTLQAIELGAAHGYRMFECDAKLSADGVLFLLHDATLERTTNGTGTASTLSWAALSELDAGRWHSPAFTGVRLPSLESVFSYCQENGLLLNIEIKPTPGQEAETGRAVADLANRYWRSISPSSAKVATPPLLTSFQTKALESAKATAPELPRGLLLDEFWLDWQTCAQQLQCVALVCHHSLWSANTVQFAHQQGWRAMSYTVNDDAVAAQLLGWGVDSLITDRVDHFTPES